MQRKITSSEETRRSIAENYDEKPSIHHIFNYEISKNYIKNKKILDIGCWTGQFVQLALKSTNRVYGIDPGIDAIAFAKKKYPKATFKVGVAQQLPFNKNSFDVVTYLEVIEHLPKEFEDVSIKEIHRVLRKKGTLILSTPSNHLVSIMLDPAFFLIGHRHYSERYVTSLLENQGFAIKKVYTTGGYFRLIRLIIDSLAKHLLHTQINYPSFILNKIKDEYYSGGFAQLHIVAEKK